MPELPDVEAVKNKIRKVKNRTIEKIEIIDKSIIKFKPIKLFIQYTNNTKINQIERRGKFLLFSLSSGYTLIIHLGMTGNMEIIKTCESFTKYTKVIWLLDNKNKLLFICPRRLGKVTLVYNKNFDLIPCLKNMGPEPLDRKFSLDVLKDKLNQRKIRIKPLLLDQSFIAGIGNIYADIILFDAKIHPEKRVYLLNSKEIIRLYNSIKKVLSFGIKNYYNIEKFKDWFGNYRDKESLCPRCKTSIKNKKITGRTCYFCSNCQRLI